MSTYVSAELQAGLDAARVRRARRRARLRVEGGGASHAVLRIWEGGFALDAGEAPRLRGLVDLYDGAHHLGRCLVVASDEEGGERRYEFKRPISAPGGAALDFARDEAAPAGLIADAREG